MKRNCFKIKFFVSKEKEAGVLSGLFHKTSRTKTNGFKKVLKIDIIL